MSDHRPGPTSTPKRIPQAPRISRIRRRINGPRRTRQIPESARINLFPDDSRRSLASRLRGRRILVTWTNRGDRWVRTNGLSSRSSFKSHKS